MDKLIQLLNEIGFPYAYSHFAEGENPKAPYICYSVNGTDNFGADNSTYFKINQIQLELYTDKKDLEAERKIEDALYNSGIFYQKYETWIESEKLYQNVYQFEITGGNANVK